jgi:hypothetical protein
VTGTAWRMRHPGGPPHQRNGAHEATPWPRWYAPPSNVPLHAARASHNSPLLSPHGRHCGAPLSNIEYRLRPRRTATTLARCCCCCCCLLLPASLSSSPASRRPLEAVQCLRADGGVGAVPARADVMAIFGAVEGSMSLSSSAPFGVWGPAGGGCGRCWFCRLLLALAYQFLVRARPQRVRRQQATSATGNTA